jgi:PAS domain S-box-containing protein
MSMAEKWETAPLTDAQRFAAIVEFSDDAIISKDLNGIITSWNPGAERLFGYAPSEVIGRSITVLIPLERQDEEPGILERIRRGERVDHYETVRRRKDGELDRYFADGLADQERGRGCHRGLENCPRHQ